MRVRSETWRDFSDAAPSRLRIRALFRCESSFGVKQRLAARTPPEPAGEDTCATALRLPVSLSYGVAERSPCRMDL